MIISTSLTLIIQGMRLFLFMKISCFIIDTNHKEELYYKPFAFEVDIISTYETSSFYQHCTDVTLINGEVFTVCAPFAQINNIIKPEYKLTQKHGIR